MRDAGFSAASPGRLVTLSPSDPSVLAFVPNDIPRGIQLTTSNTRLLGEASRALGQLQMGVEALPNAELFLMPFQMNEAVQSNRIEGTHTTLVEALADAAAGAAKFASGDVVLVRNYRLALHQGLEALAAGRPLNVGLLTALQDTLLTGDPRHDRLAGRVRNAPVALGTEDCKRDIKLARFIPPPPLHLTDCLDDFDRYLNEKDSDDGLVRIALAHYQFETIHPFGDGNGRVGRVLIALQMMHEGVVTKPWVYVSPEVDRRKEQYVSALYNVSARGSFAEWIDLFLDVVLASARATVAKIGKLRALEADIQNRLDGYQSQLPMRLIPELFRMPVITVPDTVRALGCKPAAARDTLQAMAKRGIVTQNSEPLRHRGQRGRPPAMFYCNEIIRIMLET